MTRWEMVEYNKRLIKQIKTNNITCSHTSKLNYNATTSPLNVALSP